MDRSFPIGPIRPPSEASSLLLQVTQGCTWNRCSFCVTYAGQGFRVLKPEEIKNNIDNMACFRDMLLEHVKDGKVDKEGLYRELEKMNSAELQCFYMIYNWIMSGSSSVFLQDGNSIALAPEKLADVLVYLREKFPHIQRITTYGRAETLARWSEDQLRMLKDAGLDRIHTGFESGSDRVLKLINKGLTRELEILGGRNAKAAGMELSVYFMPGIGGRDLSEESARETAEVVDAIGPDFVRLRTFVVKRGSQIDDMVATGRFTECDDREKLREIRDLIEGIHTPDVNIVSDHIVNLAGDLNGTIGREKQQMLNRADMILKLPEERFRVYQLARRHGYIEGLSQLPSIPDQKMAHFRETADQYSYEDPSAWNEHINDILRQYV